ncbi:Imm61 family immunity protein [Agromyces sp. NPDC056965]|uniref:Imm61 family immunity protein n=1 Tax=Agromyces sp. NPDC056965 TaxID=3345983 RepID=UPI00363DAF1A
MVDTEESATDAELFAFAKLGRVVPFPSDDALLCIGDMEVRYEIHERDGRYELLRRERSGPGRVIVSSADLGVVRRVLIQQIAVNVRARQRLRRVALPIAESALQSGFVLEEGVDGGVELHWAEAGEARSASFPAGSAGSQQAVKLSRYAAASEHELIESMLDVAGRPLFRVG